MLSFDRFRFLDRLVGILNRLDLISHHLHLLLFYLVLFYRGFYLLKDSVLLRICSQVEKVFQ